MRDHGLSVAVVCTHSASLPTCCCWQHFLSKPRHQLRLGVQIHGLVTANAEASLTVPCLSTPQPALCAKPGVQFLTSLCHQPSPSCGGGWLSRQSPEHVAGPGTGRPALPATQLPGGQGSPASEQLPASPSSPQVTFCVNGGPVRGRALCTQAFLHGQIPGTGTSYETSFLASRSCG